MTPDLNASYDLGYFDKDEQGWCARRVDVFQNGDTVTVHESGDDNGLRAYESTARFHIAEYLPEQALVRLTNSFGRLERYFDLNRRQLRSATERHAVTFSPPANASSQPAREALAAALLPVALALGLPAHSAPALPLPELTPSPTAEGALEAKATTSIGVVQWTWMRRFYPDDGLGNIGPQQMSVALSAPGHGSGLVSVFVQSPSTAHFLINVSVEDLPALLPLRDKAIVTWTAQSFSTDGQDDRPDGHPPLR